MRLVCPNCGAQYEVDDRVIPETGRDVQCSNCGFGWFQRHPDQDAELAEELGTPLPEAEPEAQTVAEQTPEPDPDSTPDPVPEPDSEPVSEPEPEPEPELRPAPSPQGLDDGVRDILRQEAEFEMEQRAHDHGQLESQPELGLDEIDPEEARRRTVQERMARLRGLDEMPDEADEDSGARRDLLPDIEEISSSLDGDDVDPGNLPPDATVAPARRGGFRRGFLMMLLLAAIIALLYVYAPKLAETVPGSGPYLEAYVALIDQARAALDTLLQGAIDKMQGPGES